MPSDDICANLLGDGSIKPCHAYVSAYGPAPGLRGWGERENLNFQSAASNPPSFPGQQLSASVIVSAALSRQYLAITIRHIAAGRAAARRGRRRRYCRLLAPDGGG